MTVFRLGLGAIAAALLAADVHAAEVSRYDHIFVIVAENKNYEQIVGSPAAPRLNALAKEYGLATAYYGVVHPSQPNYIAMLGGDTFGIHDNDAWFCKPLTPSAGCSYALTPFYAPHSVQARSLMDQLEDAKLTWKGYFEDIPGPGSLALFNPGAETPDPGRPKYLYAAKHNAFLIFERTRNDPKLAEKVVPLDQLKADLATGALPNYAQIVLNQCNDMHGLSPAEPSPPADCIPDLRKPETMEAVIRRGDKAIGAVVDGIMAAPAWAGPRNIAIVIAWDEDSARSSGPQGCCGFDPQSRANYGGGHVPAIVVTNHGPRGVEDATPYNHYSLLRTVEEAFGIAERLGFAAAEDKGVKAMAPLFGSGKMHTIAGAEDTGVRK
jgi:phosphatidylinositol-3-phosphatase